LLFFGSIVDVLVLHDLAAVLLGTIHGQSSGQGGLAMVDVTDGTNVDVGLRADEVFLSHQFLLGLFHNKISTNNPWCSTGRASEAWQKTDKQSRTAVHFPVTCARLSEAV